MFTFSGQVRGRVAHAVLGRLTTASYSVVGFVALSVRVSAV